MFHMIDQLDQIDPEYVLRFSRTSFRFGQDVYRLDLTNLTWKLLVEIANSVCEFCLPILPLRLALESLQCTGIFIQQQP